MPETAECRRGRIGHRGYVMQQGGHRVVERIAKSVTGADLHVAASPSASLWHRKRNSRRLVVRSFRRYEICP